MASVSQWLCDQVKSQGHRLTLPRVTILEVLSKAKYHLSDQEAKSFRPHIGLKLEQKDRHSLITISDNGVGIKDEDKAKIFAPYFTTKSSYKSGTGIGVYVVRRMIEENHKGKIWFESEYLKGTTFFIQLPRK